MTDLDDLGKTMRDQAAKSREQIAANRARSKGEVVIRPDQVEPYTDQLPEGKVCADCAWFNRCRQLFRCRAESRSCDWDPSRFQEVET